MRLVHDLGGSYAFCDTDSLFIVATEHGKLIPCPGGEHNTPTGQAAIKALTWDDVSSAVIDRFAALDPYQGPSHPKSILKIEDENYDPATGRQREIECYAIASKRYGLFKRRPDGTPEIVMSGDKQKRSEHGLGHLLPHNAQNPDISDRAWLDQWWEHLLHLELGYTDHPEPTWFDAPAVGRLTVTSQRDIKAFNTYNHDKPYTGQVKPWGFLTIAHPAPYERARQDGPNTLIAPFERDPVRRLQADWTNRNRPNEPSRRIHTAMTPEYRPGSVAVLSYRDYFNQYRQHPEAKALDPKDHKPCHPLDQGPPTTLEAHRYRTHPGWEGKQPHRRPRPSHRRPNRGGHRIPRTHPQMPRMPRRGHRAPAVVLRGMPQETLKKHSRRIPQGHQSMTSTFRV
jgi:hypothetical protein